MFYLLAPVSLAQCSHGIHRRTGLLHSQSGLDKRGPPWFGANIWPARLHVTGRLSRILGDSCFKIRATSFFPPLPMASLAIPRWVRSLADARQKSRRWPEGEVGGRKFRDSSGAFGPSRP